MLGPHRFPRSQLLPAPAGTSQRSAGCPHAFQRLETALWSRGTMTLISVLTVRGHTEPFFWWEEGGGCRQWVRTGQRADPEQQGAMAGAGQARSPGRTSERAALRCAPPSCVPFTYSGALKGARFTSLSLGGRGNGGAGTARQVESCSCGFAKGRAGPGKRQPGLKHCPSLTFPHSLSLRSGDLGAASARLPGRACGGSDGWRQPHLPPLPGFLYKR